MNSTASAPSVATELGDQLHTKRKRNDLTSQSQLRSELWSVSIAFFTVHHHRGIPFFLFLHSPTSRVFSGGVGIDPFSSCLLFCSRDIEYSFFRVRIPFWSRIAVLKVKLVLVIMQFLNWMLVLFDHSLIFASIW